MKNFMPAHEKFTDSKQPFSESTRANVLTIAAPSPVVLQPPLQCLSAGAERWRGPNSGVSLTARPVAPSTMLCFACRALPPSILQPAPAAPGPTLCSAPPAFPAVRLYPRVGRPVRAAGPRLGTAGPAAGRSPQGAPARPAEGWRDCRDLTSPPGVPPGPRAGLWTRLSVQVSLGSAPPP